MTPSLRKKIGSKGVLGLCLEVHKLNTGASESSAEYYAGLRGLLREVLREWEPSKLPQYEAFDELVRSMIKQVLVEENSYLAHSREKGPSAEPVTMQVVRCDNFDRDNVPDAVVAKQCPRIWAEHIAAALNIRFGGPDSADYFKAVPLSYKLKEADL